MVSPIAVWVEGIRLEVSVQIVPIAEEYSQDLRKCLDAVARERRYLGFVEAPPLASVRESVLSNIAKNLPLKLYCASNVVEFMGFGCW